MIWFLVSQYWFGSGSATMALNQCCGSRSVFLHPDSDPVFIRRSDPDPIFKNMLEKLKNNIQYLPQMLYFYIKAFLPYFGFDIENVGLCVLVWMLAVFSWLLFLSLFMDSVSLFNYLFLFFIIIKTHNLGYGELKLGALLRRVFPIV